LAVALFCAQRPADALAAVDRAGALRASALDPAFDAQLALVRAQCLGALDRLDECAAAAEEAIELYRSLGDPDPMAAAILVLGIAHEAGGDGDAAQSAYARAADAARDADMRAEARTRRARLLAGSSRAEEIVDDLVDWLNRAVTNPAEADQARYFLGVALLNSGRPAEAAENAEDALTGFEARDEQPAVDQTRRLLYAVYRQLDEPDQALAQLDELLASPMVDDDEERGHLHEEAGSILYARDRDAIAAHRFDAAAQAYQTAGLVLDRARALRRGALALRWSGDLDAAVGVLPELDRLVDGLPVDPENAPEAVFERAMLGYDAARLLIEVDRAEDALPRIVTVPAHFRSIEAFAEAMGAELVLGEVLLRLDRPTQAESVLRPVLAGLPRDSGALSQAAWLLAAALQGQGREDEAAALRAEYGLTEE
jgi:tetratricopeptide (TPR) repeat protein